MAKKDNDWSRRKFLGAAGALTAASLLPHAELSATPFPSPPSSGQILPPMLRPGDTIAMVAPAGAVFSTKHIPKFEGILKTLGFKVIKGKTLYSRHGYLSGKDDYRAAEINELFADPNVNGIIAMRGGWGCARMLDLIDYNTIAANPKVLMGYSDITALLIAITAKTGLVTFHGPVGYSSWNEFSTRYVKDILMQNNKSVTLINPSFNEDARTIVGGKATGQLYGGNLTVLQGIIGSNFVPDWNGKLLFLEETREEVYRIDRMLTTLKLAGVLDQISGFIFGKCMHCDPEFPDESLSLKEMLDEHLKPLKKPAYFGSMFGHVANKFTVPLGLEAELDADTGHIKLLGSAVKNP